MSFFRPIMHSPHRLQSIKTRTDTSDLSRYKQPSRYAESRPEHEPYVSSSGTGTSAVQPRRHGMGSPLSTPTDSYHSTYTARGSPLLTVSDSFSSYYSALQSPRSSHIESPRTSSYYSASTRGSPRSSRIESPRSRHTSNELPSSCLPTLPTTSTSTIPSNTSFPFTIRSVNSSKSRKNVHYPGRAPPTAPLELEHVSISPEILISQVRFLCTTTLRHAKSCLVPAGEMILQSLAHNGDFLQPVDEETLCCAELFVELTGPCNTLHGTFKDILFKSGAFAFPSSPKSIETPFAAALALQQYTPAARSSVVENC
ncbi:hypothetical protein EI94DRAFT_148132 [Lactarius quietus]|nr:hypothetical protein EI94DRAFT_148132 [Lactarius quietus]